MKLVNESERMGPWAVGANGIAMRVARGMSLSLVTTRAVVIASNADEALAACNAEAFAVGVKNGTDDEPPEIAIYGEIGDPWQQSDAGSVNQFLRANKGRDVNVRINSPGGLAYDGICMHNAFLNHDAKVTTIVEGFAGSAATVAAVGGNPAQIYDNATFFIHRASLLAYGNRDAMAEAMEWLDQVDEAIARTYKAKTGKAFDKIMEMMRGPGKQDGTKFSAREAVESKFCNEVIPLKKNAGAKAVAVVDQFGHVQEIDANTLSEPQSHRSVELARAIRMRVRNELFVPAESNVAGGK